MLVFPEGRKGTEKLYKDRYQLRRFGRGGFVEAAMRARVADRPDRRGRRRGGDADLRPRQPAAAPDRAPLLPDHADVPALRAGWLRSATCRPSSGSASWSRSRPTSGARSRGDDRGLVQTVADEIRSRIQEELIDMVVPPPLGVVRMTAKRILVTGVSHLLGRAPRAGARGDARASRRSSASAPTTRAAELERTEFVRVGTAARAAAPDRAGGGDRHGGRHAAGRRLADGLPARGARDQRDRDDEHPRRLRRAGLAGAQGRLQVLGALLRLRARRPGVLHRGDAAPAPAAHAPGVATSSRPRTPSRASPSATRDVTVTVLRFANALGPDMRTSHTALLSAARDPGILGFDPRYQFVHEDDIVGVARATPSSTTCRASTTSPATACWCSRRSRRLLGQAAGADPAAVGDGAGRRARCKPPASAMPDEMLNQLRYGRGLDNRKLKARGLRLALHDPRDRAQARRGPARARAARRRAASPTATSARSRSSCATARASRRKGSCERPASWLPGVRSYPGDAPTSRTPHAAPSCIAVLVHRSCDVVLLVGAGGAVRVRPAARTTDRRGRARSTASTSAASRRPQARDQAARRAAASRSTARSAPATRARRFTLTPRGRRSIGVDIDGSVDRAIAASREGNIFTRTWREVRGSELERRRRGQDHLRRAAVRQLVRARAATSSTVEPRDASVDLESGNVDPVHVQGRPGGRRRPPAARHRARAARRRRHADRPRARPRVGQARRSRTEELAKKYPASWSSTAAPSS